jgi:hypothetical protein
LQKAYKLRYADELPDCYSIHLQQTKIIVELDRTVFEIRKGFEFKSTGGRKPVTRLEFEIENKNPAVLNRNVMYGGYDVKKIFTEKSKWIALLVYSNHSIIEGVGEVDGLPDDGIFNEPGIYLDDGPTLV